VIGNARSLLLVPFFVFDPPVCHHRLCPDGLPRLRFLQIMTTAERRRGRPVCLPCFDLRPGGRVGQRKGNRAGPAMRTQSSIVGLARTCRVDLKVSKRTSGNALAFPGKGLCLARDL